MSISKGLEMVCSEKHISTVNFLPNLVLIFITKDKSNISAK